MSWLVYKLYLFYFFCSTKLFWFCFKMCHCSWQCLYRYTSVKYYTIVWIEVMVCLVLRVPCFISVQIQSTVRVPVNTLDGFPKWRTNFLMNGVFSCEYIFLPLETVIFRKFCNSSVIKIFTVCSSELIRPGVYGWYIPSSWKSWRSDLIFYKIKMLSLECRKLIIAFSM